MGIFVSNTADIAAAMTVASGVTFTEADLVFGKPRAATQAEVTKYGKNSVVGVNSAPTSTKSLGWTTVFYDRLSLAPLETVFIRGILVGEGLTLAQWLPIFKGVFPIGLEVVDLIEHATATVNGKTNAILEAASTSLGWVGTATLKFDGFPDISTAFTTDKLLGF